MSPALKTTLFVSIALASFAGAANAGSYKRLHLDRPLLGSAYDDMSMPAFAADPEVTTISKAAEAAMELIEENDVLENLLGDDDE
jgi:hypothetical protein